MQPDNSLKDLVKSVSDLCALISDSTTGFSLKEITDVVALGEDVQVAVADAPSYLAQYKGLDDVARADVDQAIAAEVKFPANLSVQSYVQKVLEGAVALSTLFSLFGAKKA